MYSAAVAAFLNADVDRIRKQWRDVATFFFAMNEDTSMGMLFEIAIAFENMRQPHLFRIDAFDIELYLKPVKLTSNQLEAREYINGVDFIEDDAGLRLTFPTLRRLILASGNKRLIDGYELIDAMYQAYVRYEHAMSNRKHSTHWTLVERINEFTKPMQPHLSSPCTMNAQPRVFTIVKGTAKTLRDRFAKQAKRNAEQEHPKFSCEKAIPIYESTLPDVQDEIDAVLNYLKQQHELPYRKSQIGLLDAEEKKITAISRTKCSIKTMKSMILIDPSQPVYTADMLSGHVQHVRELLQRGVIGRSGRPASDGNTTNIDIFKRTKGKFMDTYLVNELNPASDTSIRLRTPIAPVFSIPNPIAAVTSIESAVLANPIAAVTSIESAVLANPIAAVTSIESAVLANPIAAVTSIESAVLANTTPLKPAATPPKQLPTPSTSDGYDTDDYYDEPTLLATPPKQLPTPSTSDGYDTDDEYDEPTLMTTPPTLPTPSTSDGYDTDDEYDEPTLLATPPTLPTPSTSDGYDTDDYYDEPMLLETPPKQLPTPSTDDGYDTDDYYDEPMLLATPPKQLRASSTDDGYDEDMYEPRLTGRPRPSRVKMRSPILVRR
jgi:hypothetical protein